MQKDGVLVVLIHHRSKLVHSYYHCTTVAHVGGATTTMHFKKQCLGRHLVLASSNNQVAFGARPRRKVAHRALRRSMTCTENGVHRAWQAVLPRKNGACHTLCVFLKGNGMMPDRTRCAMLIASRLKS